MKTKKENNKSKILICQLFLGHDKTYLLTFSAKFFVF